ncbi:hypothetical protein WJX72_006416 [[Myrmecia] bisecta]|uniref:DNA-directed DNA polymerase n=1 Tax=[Myrmecia] bisecta TaxID=41462 RepID=A0AAW1P5J2_9CHLO
MMKEAFQIAHKANRCPEHHLSAEEKAAHAAATRCYLCEGAFDDPENPKIVEHHHMSGDYRGAAHQKCNDKCRRSTQMSVFFHNGRGYDFHLIQQRIGAISERYVAKRRAAVEAFNTGLAPDQKDLRKKVPRAGANLSCITQSSEKYSAIYWRLAPRVTLVFKDSCCFLLDSLDNLAKMQKGNLPITRKFFEDQGYSAKQVELLLRKGVFPYEWLDDPAKLRARQLPSREDFVSGLNDTECSETEYAHAQNVWRVFKCKVFQDYLDLYLLGDVMLLSDVFQNFRKFAMDTYRMDPAHYISAPGLFWDALLKQSKVSLDMFTAGLEDMYYFCENIRGGVSTINHHYAKANNPYLPDFDSSQPTTYIIYKDSTNLYGNAMCRKLPEGGYEWVLEPGAFDFMAVETEGDTGYICEVDLAYDEALHDTHNMCPVAAEQVQLDISMLSQRCLEQRGDSKALLGSKLVPNLRDKTKYVCDIRLLQQYARLGLRVTKVHRVLRFRQRDWMQGFIEFNTAKRKEASEAGNKFLQAFFKLANCSVFGKTLENVRGYKDVQIETSKRGFLRQVAKPTFKNVHPFPDCACMVGVEHAKMRVLLNKPVAVGFCVLELSKRIMYDFHYDHMLRIYGADKLKLLFSDTDSLCYLVETEDVYRDMAAAKHLYDLSGLPKNHWLYDTTNEKKLGTMTDEAKGNIISEFKGVREKLYAFLMAYHPEVFSSLPAGAYADPRGLPAACERRLAEMTEAEKEKLSNREKKTCKGVKKKTVDKHVSMADLKDCEEDGPATRSFQVLRSHEHVVFTETVTKVAYSPYDDKRYQLDGVDTLAYGHYRIKQIEDAVSE